MQETQRSLDSDGVVTLRELAALGTLDGTEKLSCADLAERLDASTQTASRRLQRLEDGEYISREMIADGQLVEITDRGAQRLQAEYAAYQRIFEGETVVELTGTATSGMGEGRHYITLDGYMTQFRDKLGYEPYAGTLNIDLDEDSVRSRSRLSAMDPVTIEGWETEERTYGPAYCYPATLSSADQSYDRAHVIAPERTHHGDDHLEVIAPERLRAELELEDGTEVTVSVSE
jgi:riboflavin kinase